MLSVLDSSGASSRAALQGEAALGEGDLALAQKRFAEGADILTRRAVEMQDSTAKAFLRFLATSQHFRGGNYQAAAKLCRKINRDKLPEEAHGRFPGFSAEVERRASPGYVARARLELASTWKAGKHREAIRRLQDDPFLLNAPALAFVRGVYAEEVGTIAPPRRFLGMPIVGSHRSNSPQWLRGTCLDLRGTHVSLRRESMLICSTLFSQVPL